MSDLAYCVRCGLVSITPFAKRRRCGDCGSMAWRRDGKRFSSNGLPAEIAGEEAPAYLLVMSTEETDAAK